MLNWKKLANATVYGKLRFTKDATLVTDNADGTTTSMSVSELAALNDLGATDLAKIDGITNGTIAAGKAVVVDSNKDASAFRNVTLTNLDAGASGTAGTVDVFPTTAAKGKIAITAADSAGDTTTTIVNASQAAARTYTIPDAGASASFVMTEGAQTIAGAKSLTGRLTTTDGVASGTARVVGGLAYSNTAASTAVTNTTTETLFDTKYSIPANTLKAGTKLRVRFQGIATATNGTDTLAIALKIGSTDAAPPVGGTTLISMAATDVANNDVFTGEYELICRTAGASGTMVGVGTYKSIPAAEGTMTIKDDILASTTIDTTAAQLLAVSATWSVANAGNSVRLDFMSVEIV